MAQHKVELGVIVLDAELGAVPVDRWRLENVSGKLMANGDDALSYRLVYADPKGWPGRSTLLVKVWPLLPDKRRRDGRPEVGFMVHAVGGGGDGGGGATYEPTVAYSLVFTAANAPTVAVIYFGLEDHNFESTGPPLWRLSVNESWILAVLPCLAGRWRLLPPIHPDPQVDPGVPIEKRPQSDPRWGWFRQDCQHYELFKGKLSGSRMYDFIGGGYDLDAFLRKDGTFKGNHLTRNGKATECKIVLAHLLHFANYTMRECGTYVHRTIPDACGTPDAILVDPTRTFDSLPAWVKTLWLKEADTVDPKTIDWTTGVFEAKSMKYLDKHRKGPEIRPEHICQVYWAMICSGTYWGELARCCDESKQGRVYRIYRYAHVTPCNLAPFHRLTQAPQHVPTAGELCEAHAQ